MSTLTSTAATLPLAPGTWSVDTAHSSVEFTIRHLGISKVRGRFNRFDASLSVGDTLETTSFRADIDLSSIDTNHPDRDAHLRTTDFFDLASHPSMTFESTGIRHDGGDRYTAVGDLTINGITQSVDLDVEFNRLELYPMDQKRHGGFSASGTISRGAFGVDFDVPLGVDKVALGDKVKIEIEIQFVDPS